MSIRSQIQMLVGTEELKFVEPFPRRHGAKRHVLLPKLLYLRLHGSLGGDTEEDGLMSAALAQLRAFIAGGHITVCTDPRAKKKTAVLARVDPLALQMFDFRCQDPFPGTRLIGAFAETDIFVGLRCYPRPQLAQKNFGNAVREARTAWDSLFGAGSLPVSSSNIRDYVSENVLVV